MTGVQVASTVIVLFFLKFVVDNPYICVPSHKKSTIFSTYHVPCNAQDTEITWRTETSDFVELAFKQI